MTLDQALQQLTWLLYVGIFVAVALRATRVHTRAHVDMMLFFGTIALLLLLSVAPVILPFYSPAWLARMSGALFMLLPSLLMRLVTDFRRLDRRIVWLTTLCTGLSALALLVLPSPPSFVLLLFVAVTFIGVTGLATWAFLREAALSRGVTRRRMQAVGAGSLCLALVLLCAVLLVAFPAWAGLLQGILRILSVCSGLSYALGFAPPAWVRRAWQDPELRAFLGRAASLPRLTDLRSVVQELERGTAAAVGTSRATIGVCDPEATSLRFFRQEPLYAPLVAGAHDQTGRVDGLWEIPLSSDNVSARVLRTKRALFVRNLAREDPSNAAVYRAYGAQAALAAPIWSGERALGVLVVYAEREPIFAQSDLELIELLAEQAAVVLQSRALIEEAALLQAREQAAALKEDFLSSAAHDLKTPLTVIITQTEVMLRRAETAPSVPMDLAGLRRILETGRRMRAMVLELLDASRLDQGQLVGRRERLNLAALVQAVRTTDQEGRGPVRVVAPDEVPAMVDAARIRQLLENLVENALKYSPDGGDVLVDLAQKAGSAHLRVQDHGIGIPLADLPHVFERFHRGQNVNDRTYAGLGLGLFICQGIAEQHGGRIWVESAEGVGSTFHVELPTDEQAAVNAELTGRGGRAPVRLSRQTDGLTQR